MYRLDAETLAKLISEAKKYNDEEYELFACEIGWDDWMNDFTEVPEGEPLTEKESHEINEVLHEIFEHAHGRKYFQKPYWYSHY